MDETVLVTLARVAERAERYDEMADFMKQRVAGPREAGGLYSTIHWRELRSYGVPIFPRYSQFNGELVAAKRLEFPNHLRVKVSKNDRTTWMQAADDVSSFPGIQHVPTVLSIWDLL